MTGPVETYVKGGTQEYERILTDGTLRNHVQSPSQEIRGLRYQHTWVVQTL